MIYARPFRAPHPTISAVANDGGGAVGSSRGEVSLAHNGGALSGRTSGVSPLCARSIASAVEERTVRIVAPAYGAEFPAGFMLVAAMNPCPCGYYGHP
jgi:magnesium chelatase family protein